MDIFVQLMDAFAQIPHVKDWDEIQSLFRRVSSGKPKHWLLPLRTYEASGGYETFAVPAMMAVACAHISIILVDDMLDSDPRGLHVEKGEGAVANMASALQAAAVASVSNCDLDADKKLIAIDAVNEMFLATSLGQYWDVNSVIGDEGSYWKIARAKSSPFFGSAFQVGGLMGDASLEAAAQLKDLGVIYGEMVQIHDDLDDTLAVPAKPDWNEGRAPLPILFAREVKHPSRSRFVELLARVREDATALEEAQQILIASGAVSYCIHQLLQRYDLAQGVSSGILLERRDVLVGIFEGIMQPVFTLLQEVDLSREAPRVDMGE